MSGSISGDKCEPNLVPILDMVFQLITFFMLVVNFKNTAVDHELHLPVVGSAQPAEEEMQGELLVVNLRTNGDIFVRGKPQPNFEGFIGVEANNIRAAEKLAPGTPLPTTVVIRADRTVTVKSVMRVVDLCRAKSFDKFDFVVVRAAKSKG
jgi:biopolymer transport protein ExbD